jgi:hypothetical protein
VTISERDINNLAANHIVLRRAFSHLGALALNWNRATALIRDSSAQKSQRESPLRNDSGAQPLKQAV